MEIARVTPLYKAGSRDLRTNYRQISMLSILSKLLEKHVAISFISYLVNNSLLYKFQSAFRKGYSTEFASIKLTDEVAGMVLPTSKKLLTWWIINCGCQSSSFTELAIRSYLGLHHMSPTDLTSFLFTDNSLIAYPSSKVFHRDQSWGQYCSCYLSITCHYI